MPFNDAKHQMNQAQAARQQQELELLAAKEKLAKTTRAKDNAARFSEQEAAALAKQEKALQKQVQKIKATLETAQSVELDARGAFADFSDPRKHLGQLTDDMPILLFPLRIETRFKTISRDTPTAVAAPAVRHELWVRVYPDDIAVDSFEPLLSESEAKNAATYFAAIEAAGDDEGLKRAAWRSLVASHGSGRAHWIMQNSQPQDGAAAPDTKLQGWTQAPKTHMLPERLVLMAFNNGTEAPVLEALSEPIPASLAVGPDPSLDENEQIRIENGNIVVNPEMKWMVNFEEALAKGMGFKIPLTAQQAQNGFDKLYVLGVKLGADSKEGKRALETLLDHHHHSRKGFGLLRQGTPTNNTDTEGAEYSWQEDADESFDRYFPTAAPSDPADWETKKDGRILAEMLGIDAATLQPVRHYYHTDMAEAKAMHHALWPATLGYFMETMMEPVFSDATIHQARDFFCRYVSGRGAIPAIRVGKQPYGVLPATPFRRMQWLRRADKGFLLKLYNILQTMSTDWDGLLDDVAHVGKDGDPHQLLLDIVGLHPASVEFYSRNAQSFEQLLHTFALHGLGGIFIAALIAAGYVKSGMDLLEKFGYAPEAGEGIPDMLQKFFFDRGDLLKGPVVDDVPLSELEAIRDYTDDGRNYIEWLIDAANTSHNALRAKQGFTDNQTPSALLFLMLHHALDLGYVDTSLRLKLSKDIITPAEMVKARQEPKFIHIQEQNDAGSRWQDLYKADARITGDATLHLGDFIATIIPDNDDARQLRDQLDALDYLKNVPTARLERLFAEHLDLCTYRLDAWIQGLVHYQLDHMRHQQQETQQGIYLGAYGWLENVRPENKVLTPVELPDELAMHFADSEHPLTSDSTNGGYIHAPSTNHAVTAAVLRNGYMENASAENPGSFAVNLTSNRVRLALGIIEGMQAGQSLSALLGYQLERGLHDNHAAEVDGIIYNLRLAFPLRSNRLKSTEVEDLDSIDTVEARNVVDALSLIEQIQKTENKHYPFDHPKLPTNLSTAQKQVIDAEVERILNINDAVADLAIAESVHQVVQGNYDRAAATLDTYSKGNFPPTPDVIKTPRSGVTLTHRVGLQLETGLNPAAAINITPRSKAEPAVNKWLGSILPAMDDLACKIEFTSVAGITQNETVTLDMLGFLPIDALYMVSMQSSQAMASLDDAFTLYVLENFSPAPDSDITLLYTESVAGKISLHEAAPLLHSVRALLQRSRPLNASDISLMHEGTVEASKQNIALDKTRIILCRTELNTLKTQITDYADALTILLTPQDADLIMPELDAIMQDLAKLLQKLAFFGLPQAGSGFIFQWQQTHFRALSKRLETFLQRQQERLDSFDATMSDYTALPGTTTDAERYTLLQTAERFISTQRGDTDALSPNDFRDDLLNVRKPAFEQWLSDTLDVLASASLSDMYAALLPVVADVPVFDTEAFALTDEQSQLLVFAKDLLAKAEAIRDDLQTRLDAVDDLITQHDNAATAPEKVNALLEAGKLLLGEEFKIIPEFTLSPTQAAEWQSAYDNQAQILSYQLNTLAEDFPVDNWLYGIARIREKMTHVEQVAIMAEALANKPFTLEPVQLPYRENDNWLALEYPVTPKITEDKVLYTAHYVAAFDSTRPQCGLLLDEWTEIIPGTEETTGLTFHYDRPNTEPPQTLLLATPADFTGKWRWQDLVDTLHDTLDLAKKRAVEPEQIDRTSYARFLPALVSAFTVYPITASLNLALNNQFHLLKVTEDE